MPQTQVPDARPAVWEYLDVAVLFAALLIGTWLVHKIRSRRWIVVLMLFSLAYFGFWRKGCVCSIGAIGNVAWSLGDPDYAVPIAAVIFFALPLIFTLFFGRIFCAAVCPLGAIQDLVVVHPIRIPMWLESALRLFAYAYLAAAVLFAVTSSVLLICRYDPFVPIFRLGGSFHIFILGGALLIIGLFIGRPYCRFICPYGVILRLLGRLSRKPVTITPDECIHCRLCEDACPFNAIEKPTTDWPEDQYTTDKRRLALLLLLVPVLIAGLAWAGARLGEPMSRAHRKVRLADRIYLENTGQVKDITDPSKAFRGTGQTAQELYTQANQIRSEFRIGGAVFGGFIGFVIAGTLVLLSIRWKRTDYIAHPGGCVACGRCFEFCPREHLRRGIIVNPAKDTNG
ncbi:MAG: 4Fe-4S binding protein [Sedimentisphaerales bacterium]|nr:4Fe-4S binding protein [Sedimentisphaerales bacterium]